MESTRLWRVTKKTAGEIIGLLIASLGWVLNALGLLKGWPSFSIIILGIIIYIPLALRRTYQYEVKIDNFENSKPKIIPKTRIGIFPVFSFGSRQTTHPPTEITAINTTSTSVIYTVEMNVDRKEKNECYFALVDFYNEPIQPTSNSVAAEVSAKIEYYDMDGKFRIKDGGISGRWWTNEEVAVSEKPQLELERTSIFPGPQGVTLALACMGTKESVIYGYNNENHKDKDFKKQEFSLGLGMYYIHVILGGVNLQQIDFWFSIWRDTISGKLEINSTK